MNNKIIILFSSTLVASTISSQAMEEYMNDKHVKKENTLIVNPPFTTNAQPAHFVFEDLPVELWKELFFLI